MTAAAIQRPKWRTGTAWISPGGSVRVISGVALTRSVTPHPCG